MADSTFCSVCFEEYTETGSKCPKLLPWSHTLCNACCWKFSQRKSVQCPRLNFQCPECRAFHWVPVSGFPTNRYALQILDMQRKLIESESKKQVEKATIDPEQAKHEKCKVHGKPCVMFCLKRECWKALCPKCPVQEHQPAQRCRSIRIYKRLRGAGENETGRNKRRQFIIILRVTT